jgi:hypothetical protein
LEDALTQNLTLPEQTNSETRASERLCDAIGREFQHPLDYSHSLGRKHQFVSTTNPRRERLGSIQHSWPRAAEALGMAVIALASRDNR